MHHLRRVLPITFGFALATASVLLACGDDDDNAVTPDASTPTPDAGGKVDSSTPPPDATTETSTDSGADTGADAGPTLTATSGNSGEIFVGGDAVIANFFEDDTILHWSNAPDCVAFVRSYTKPGSAAGKLTVGGAIVGSDGGTDQVINIDADPADNNNYLFFGPVYAAVDTFAVNVALSTLPAFAAMPVQVFRPSPATPVAVSAPAAPDAGASITVPSTTPLAITWTAPAGGFTAEQKISFRLTVLTAPGGTAKLANLFCAFPLSAGAANIPANVLAEIKARVGGPADATLHVYAGSAKEVKTATGSYFVEVARPDSTTRQGDIDAKLQ